MDALVDWSDALWLDPPKGFRGQPFWSWNSRLLPERLTRQIQAMHEAGMGGFFMHSRYGLKTPYLSEEWFAAVTACLAEARKLEMKACLYDEDRWPSGAAGGLVTRDHPELSVHKLVALKSDSIPPDAERIGSFALTLNPQGQLQRFKPLEEGQAVGAGEEIASFVVAIAAPSPWFNDGRYLDCMNPKAVAEFIRVTYQAYADRYSRDFGSLIPAIFTDEPNYSHGGVPIPQALCKLPWTPALPMEFRRRRGYDLRERLPELAWPLAGKPFSQVRHDYYRTLTELFVESFSRQIGQWCSRHNIAFTGHYLAEETFASQIGGIGSAMPHYEHQHWPGIDILTDQIDQIGTVKQATSVAAQLGKERVVSELYGCTGWDWPLEGHKFNAGWQYVLGVNFRCPHLSWYSMAGSAKRDYPASIFPHSPWWRHYRTVEDYFGRLSLMLTQGRPLRDVLVLNTIQSAWGLYLPAQEGLLDGLWQPFNKLLETLLELHYDYDLGDEDILARHAKAAPGAFCVGKMKYALVIVPPAITLRQSTVALLRRFLELGGQVLFIDSQPDRIDGAAAEGLSDLGEQATRCSQEPQVVAATLESLLGRRVSISQDDQELGDCWYMLRQVKAAGGAKQSGQLLFVQSCDRRKSHRVAVSAEGRRPVVLRDAQSGKRQRLQAHAGGERVEFELELPPSGCALVSLGISVRDALPVAKRQSLHQAVPIFGPWKAELLEPNCLVLDYCRYRIGQGQWSDSSPVLLAESRIREHFGLPPRRSGHCQPWYLAQTGRADSTVRGQAALEFVFHVEDVPERLLLAIERPEDSRILLNGQQIPSQPVGAWLDEDVKTIELAPAVKRGQNVLLLEFDYRSDMELEELHLLGPFGVAWRGPQPLPGTYAIVRPPASLAVGSWVGQGLDFYGGAVQYTLKLDASVWEAIKQGKKVLLTLPNVKCTCAAVHIGSRTIVLPWPPMVADITEALLDKDNSQCDEIGLEVIGGRHNCLGPLHTPWRAWTGPQEFEPQHKEWTDAYLLNDHGLLAEPVIQIME